MDNNLLNNGVLVNEIISIITNARNNVIKNVNNELIRAYWNIGRIIVEDELKSERGEYGKKQLLTLSKTLTNKFGKGFSRANLQNMRLLYLKYPNYQTLSSKLSWSHYVELLKIEDEQERSFYLQECENEHWGVRELKRQMNSMLFHRLSLSKSKQEVLSLSKQGQIIEKAEDVVKDPYIFEFVGLPELPVYTEGDLEEALINNLSQFLLELGKGFTYVGRQQRVNIGGRIYKVDLVFYHRILKWYYVKISDN